LLDLLLFVISMIVLWNWSFARI